MKWEDLKTEAAKIIANTPTGDFQDKTFDCRTGGPPSVPERIPVVHREMSRGHDTVRNGTAYRGSVTIRCRDTGVIDSQYHSIYECENGELFIFKYSSGDASCFDSGCLTKPIL